MSDNSADLSAEFNSFLNGIDVPNLGPPRIRSADPDAWDSFLAGIAVPSRSEERRVGKECLE